MDIKNTKQEWLSWLIQSRMICPTVIQESGLDISELTSELVIPVCNPSGNVLFRKYRRSPWKEDGPKYRYDKGATSALYGAEILSSLPVGSQVVVTEGELDSLALRSIGIPAVSTTGGSSTWKNEWSELLSGFDVVLCYDGDRAGVEGVMRVASMTPGARIARLPVGLGKDPTDILLAGGGAELRYAIENAEQWEVPARDDEKREVKLKSLIEAMGESRRKSLARWEDTPLLIDYALAWAKAELDNEKARKNYEKAAKKEQADTKLAAAKSYPIGKLVKVNHAGFAACVYHQEGSPSMKVYLKQNRAWSYCCGRGSDVVDIYMQTHGCDFKTAVNELSV